METMKIIEKHKLVPVVVFNEISEAEGKLAALIRGGLPIAEITFRTECAAEAVELAVKRFPEMLVGAGTIINGRQCEKAITCGAKFIVSPGFSEDVAAVCAERGVPYIPGTVTPTEIMKALTFGLNILKFFPASDYGGLKTIKSLAAAFPQVRFMPTGGISESNIKEYLSFGKIIACGGSWMMKGCIADIEASTKDAMKLIGELQ